MMSEKSFHTVYLALGTNLGDRLANLRAARQALAPQAIVENCSPVYETPPWGFTEQPPFLNQVIQVKTQLSPEALLAHLKEQENELGRKASFRNGPRHIDIDILLYDDLIMDTPQLTIPHPRMEWRAFVWLPLAALAPDLRHPILGKTAGEIVASLDTSDITIFAIDC
jgi:2-amino-4-hydroxy-6-hydroxymethyldihydropteridine diphosphokinase